MRFIDFPEMNFTIQGLDMVEIPPMYKMTQIYDSNKIDDPAAIHKEYDGMSTVGLIKSL